MGETEVVVRLRAEPGDPDPYSKRESLDWSNPGELPIVTLAPAEPIASTEPAEIGRHAVISGWVLYLDENADVTELDRVRVRGTVHQVIGVPARWNGGGLVVRTEAVAG